MTQIHGGHREQRHPGASRGDRQLPLRTGPHARGCGTRASRELVGREVEILANSPPAHVALGIRRVVEALRRAGGFEVQPKQAWTNVADFAARGLDAVNLGPGATRYAHAVDERVEIGELERTYAALQRFLAGTRLIVAVRALPRARRAGAVPVRAARRLEGRRSRARHRADRLRHGRPARGDAAVHPRGAAGVGRRGFVLPARDRACPSCARRSPAGSAARFGVDVDRGDRDRADARLEGGDLLVRADRARREAARRDARARLSRLRARRAVCRRLGRDRAAVGVERLAARPRRASTRGTRSRSSGSATRTTRPAPSRRSRSTRSSPRVRASTASCSAPTRRTRSCGSTSRRSPRCRSPTGRTSSSSTRSRSARR